MSQKRARSVSPESPSLIFKSSPIEDRSSKFTAFYSPTLTAEDLQAHAEVRSASHRIAAWRKSSSQRALDAQPFFETGHDDDGEKYGGKALEKVLVETGVEGAMVVARWYGGVMLGPVRFDHIKNCARDAIMLWSRDRERLAKKAKVREDEVERERLIRVLPERDESIAVLRDLLAEMSRSSSSSPPGGRAKQAKTPDYSTLPLASLEKLEQVRDATIGWVLKRMEKVENTQAPPESDDKVAAMPNAMESPRAQGHIDERSAKAEESKIEDLENQDTVSTLLETRGI